MDVSGWKSVGPEALLLFFLIRASRKQDAQATHQSTLGFFSGLRNQMAVSFRFLLKPTRGSLKKKETPKCVVSTCMLYLGKCSLRLIGDSCYAMHRKWLSSLREVSLHRAETRRGPVPVFMHLGRLRSLSCICAAAWGLGVGLSQS